MKVNFCCGGNILPGWINRDIDCDITKPLPFPDASVDFALCEHGVEHIEPAQAWGFFKECRRVLKPGGVLRIAVPSIERTFEKCDLAYLHWLGRSGFGKPTRESAVENLIVNHGHRALWSEGLLRTVFAALGFKPTLCDPGVSTHPELRGVEGHGRVIGDANNQIETIVVEGTR